MVPIPTTTRPLALVTGGSTGIGRSLAAELLDHGYDVVIAADEDCVHDTATDLERPGASVVACQVDLTKPSDVEELYEKVRSLGGTLEAVAFNAGVGVSGKFHTTPLEADLGLVDLNVRSVVHLAKLVVPEMVERGRGRLLFTSSVAGFGPGPYQATYAASKSFVHLFAQALRHELRDTGVTVTSLMPGPTETAFFDRAQMREDTVIGQMPKDDADKVARQAYAAMAAGKERVISGSLLNRVEALTQRVLPDPVKAVAQAVLAKPRSAR